MDDYHNNKDIAQQPDHPTAHELIEQDLSSAHANDLLIRVEAMLEQERYKDAAALLGDWQPASLGAPVWMRYQYLKGWCLLNLGHLDEAQNSLDRAIQIAKELKDEKCIASISYRMGVLCYRRDDFAAADRHLLISRMAIEERVIQDPQFQMYINLSLGNASLRLGNFESAVSYYHDALRNSELLPPNKWRGSVCWGLGLAHIHQGEFGVAKVELEEALRIQQDVATNSFLANVNSMYGMVLVRLNQLTAAERELRHAIYLSEQVNNKKTMVIARGNLAEAYLAQERLPEALTTAEQAVQQAQQLTGGEMDVAQLQRTLGKIYMERGELHKADAVFAVAETLISQSGDVVKHMDLLYDYARALIKAGNYALAVVKLTLACYLRNPHWHRLLYPVTART